MKTLGIVSEESQMVLLPESGAFCIRSAALGASTHGANLEAIKFLSDTVRNQKTAAACIVRASLVFSD